MKCTACLAGAKSSLWSRVSLLWLASAVLMIGPAADGAEQLPPTWSIYTETFASSTNVPSFWVAQSGSWTVRGGEYNSSSASASIATMYQYPGDATGFPSDDRIYPAYDFEVRLLAPTTKTGSTGVVFAFRDVSNYVEAVFDSRGAMEVRSVVAGVSTAHARVEPLGFGPGEWLDVKITRRWIGGVRYTIWLNGSPVLLDRALGGGVLDDGDVGVLAHDTPARVDHVVLSTPAGDQPIREDFSDGVFNGWEPTFQTLGEWSVANGAFNNTSVQQTSFARLDINPQNGTNAFTLRASMLNPYGAWGNQVGIAFNFRQYFGTRHEVIFSPTGVARLNYVSNGVVQTLASAPYPGRRNTWFEVVMQLGSQLDVAVNGRPLFAAVSTDVLGPTEGAIGFITHWAPGRFDNVRFDPSVTTPLSENFSAGLPQSASRVGVWNTNGGTLNATSAGIADLVTFGCACWKTNYVYRARLLNQYGASGNLIGLIYSYQESTEPAAGDYYEVVFAPTGEAYLNKIVNGVRYRMASARHPVGRNTWFDVELIRSSLHTMHPHAGITTTVKLNGVTLFDRVPQGQFGFGRVGVISRWSRGRFDNVSVKPLLSAST